MHFYESELEVGEIVIYPKPSRDLETYAIDQLKEYKKEVEDGTKNLRVLASLYTDDPGSKDNGGRYEINRNEKTWDPVFLAKAFSLKDGQISSVFKTKFGYHIIQMVSRNGDDAVIQAHIKNSPDKFYRSKPDKRKIRFYTNKIGCWRHSILARLFQNIVKMKIVSSPVAVFRQGMAAHL